MGRFMMVAAAMLLAAPASGGPMVPVRPAVGAGLASVQGAPAAPAQAPRTVTPQIEADVRGQQTIFTKPLRPVGPVKPQPPRGPVKLSVGPIGPGGPQRPAGLP